MKIKKILKSSFINFLISISVIVASYAAATLSFLDEDYIFADMNIGYKMHNRQFIFTTTSTDPEKGEGENDGTATLIGVKTPLPKKVTIPKIITVGQGSEKESFIIDEIRAGALTAENGAENVTTLIFSRTLEKMEENAIQILGLSIIGFGGELPIGAEAAFPVHSDTGTVYYSPSLPAEEQERMQDFAAILGAGWIARPTSRNSSYKEGSFSFDVDRSEASDKLRIKAVPAFDFGTITAASNPSVTAQGAPIVVEDLRRWDIDGVNDGFNVYARATITNEENTNLRITGFTMTVADSDDDDVTGSNNVDILGEFNKVATGSKIPKYGDRASGQTSVTLGFDLDSIAEDMQEEVSGTIEYVLTTKNIAEGDLSSIVPEEEESEWGVNRPPTIKTASNELGEGGGEKITERGQMASFTGTSSYQGVDTPSDKQNETTDNWQVMQLADETGTIVADNAPATRALIIKQNPIAVQKYRDTGQAIYDGSNLQTSTTGWEAYLGANAPTFNNRPFTDFMLPVTLNGAGQSDPSDQGWYRSVVDPEGGIVQFFVASYIDVSQGINDLDIGRDVWKNFVIGFSGNSQYTWLRSPLFDTNSAAYIGGDGYVRYYYVGTYSFGLRPACWVKI